MITDDDRFLAGFEDCTRPLSQWHHREHIKVAYLYISRYSLETAIAKMSWGIKAYNAAHQVEEGLDRGYHETLTQAWMRLVHCTFFEFGPSETADMFVDKHTQLLSKRALLFFYSRDLIMSPEAKAHFVEPDLAPLPRSKKDPPGYGIVTHLHSVQEPKPDVAIEIPNVIHIETAQADLLPQPRPVT